MERIPFGVLVSQMDKIEQFGVMPEASLDCWQRRITHLYQKAKRTRISSDRSEPPFFQFLFEKQKPSQGYLTTLKGEIDGVGLSIHVFTHVF